MPRPAAATRSARRHPRLKSLTKNIEDWFARHQRPLPWRTAYDPYQVWISEVMLQQTRMEVVLPYFARFIARFPDVNALAAATVDKVLAAWSGLGYYRRARMLHEGARAVVEQHGGSVPRDESELRAIPGVGRYTAGAIASIAFNLPRPIVDGNVARILSRIAAIERPVDSAEFRSATWSFSAALVEKSASPRSFNQGLMEVGALICRPRNPQCEICPVARHCHARKRGTPAAYPRAGRPIAAKSFHVPLYVVGDGKGRVLMRRESGPLMTGMLHLPHGSDALFSGSIGFVRDSMLGSFRHTVTDRRIHFEVWTAREGTEMIRDGSDEFLWIDPSDLSQHPHPSYVAKALALVLRAYGHARGVPGLPVRGNGN